MELWNRIKAALRSHAQLWVVLVIVSAAAVLSSFIVALAWPGDLHGVRRWSKNNSPTRETPAYLEAINHRNFGWRTSRDAASGEKQRPDGNGTPGQTVSCEKARQEVVGTPAKLDYGYPRLSVYSVPNIQPPLPRPTLKDLSDLAQARAIDAILRAKGNNDQPPGNNDKPLRSWEDVQKALGESEPGERDPFLFERVLVVTVSKGTEWLPGDRMVWNRVFVKPVNFRFAAYTVAATENETLKVSSMELTDHRKLSADIGLAIPTLGDAKIGLAPSSERTLKTTSDVSIQYEKLGLDIRPDFLRIIRESGAGGDVVGNTLVALSLTTDPERILNCARDTNKELWEQHQPDIALVVTGIRLDDPKPEMEVLPVVPLPHCALRAEVWSVYEQRHIVAGREFYDESRQRVMFIHDTDPRRVVEVMGADDVSPFVWKIQLVEKDGKPDPLWKEKDGKTIRKALSAKRPGGVYRQLVFSDYGRAAKLAHWVRTDYKKVRTDHRTDDNSEPIPSGYELNYDASKGMGMAVIKQTKDDCTDSPVIRPLDDDGQAN